MDSIPSYAEPTDADLALLAADVFAEAVPHAIVVVPRGAEERVRRFLDDFADERVREGRALRGMRVTVTSTDVHEAANVVTVLAGADARVVAAACERIRRPRA